MENIKFAGSSLGRGYSFNGLQSHFHVSYEADRDNRVLNELMQHPATAVASAADVTSQSSMILDLERVGEEVDMNRQSERSEEGWQTIQQLTQPYHFDHVLIHHLYHEQIIFLDKKKRLSFSERTLEDQETSTVSFNPDGTFERNVSTDELSQGSFWLARGQMITEVVIVDTPLEAIAAYSLDESNPYAQNTLYLAAQSPEQLPEKLDEFEEVYYLDQCDPLVKKQIEQITPQIRESNPDKTDWRTKNWQQKQQSPSQQANLDLDLELEL